MPSSSPSAAPASGRLAAALIVIAAAAAARHAGALGAPFFADDYLFLEQVRGRSLAAALAAPDPLGNFLRPVSRALHFWVVGRASGESATAFHAVNLALFLGSLAMLAALAWRLAGGRAAVVAAGYLALHHAFDVPLLWASGSQDLLALAAALGALLLHQNGRRWPAALLLAAGLLAKESVAAAPLAAVALDRARGLAWGAAARRAWPLLAATAAWLAAWGATLAARPTAAGFLAGGLEGLPAAVVHLAQTALALEPAAALGPLRRPWSLMPWLAVAGAVLWALRGTSAPAEAPQPRRAPLAAGAAWALAAAVPLAPVAAIWSAYFYGFALCGAALALGAAAARLPAPAAAALVAALGFGSEAIRSGGGFADHAGAWTARSHVSGAYLERGMRRVTGYLADLRAAHPSLPPRSVLFFGDLPGWSGWQVGDGAVVRWAYRDTSLRSHYLSSFSRARVAGRPVFFLAAEGERLRDRSSDPALLESLAFSAVLGGGDPSPARDALELELERRPGNRRGRYLLAWVRWAQGDTAAARRELARSGVAPARGAGGALAAARRALARGDTAAALPALEQVFERFGLDAGLHALLAAVWSARPETEVAAAVEAFAVTALAPGEAAGWRLLAAAQLRHGRYEPARRSLERYLAQGGAAARDDPEVRRVLESLGRILPGGDLAAAAGR